MATVIDNLAWVCVQDRRLLSVRTEGRSKFYLPGGKREPGESDVAGLRREIREELSVELDPLSFTLFGVLDEEADGFTDGRRVHMTAYTATHHGDLKPGREIAELAWLSTSEAHHCPPAGRRILSLLADANLID